MRPPLRPLIAAVPSAAAALAAALAAGLVQGLLGRAGWGPGTLAAGHAAVRAAPAGFLLAILVRALWLSWRPVATVHPAADPATAPAAIDPPAADRAAMNPAVAAGVRLASGLIFGLTAALLAGAAGWAGALAAASLTQADRLAALTVGLFAVAAGAALVLLSAPAMRAATVLVLAVERRRVERGRPPMTPDRVLRASALLAAALALLVWLALLVRAGAAAARGSCIGVAPYLTTFLVALVAAHAGGAWFRRRRAAARQRVQI